VSLIDFWVRYYGLDGKFLVAEKLLMGAIYIYTDLEFCYLIFFRVYCLLIELIWLV
jgi:hypothetical protein